MLTNPETTEQLVTASVSGDVVTIALNRPERHNALVPALLCALIAAMDAAEARVRARAVVLKATGSSFSTGGDLRAFVERAEDITQYASELVGLLNDAICRLIESRLPLIVVVDGQVTGGSMGLVLAGDEVIVTERASFTPYYSEVGFSPDGGWLALLPEIIGESRVAEAIEKNRTITAQQALEWGLAASMVSSRALPAAIARASIAVGGPDHCQRRSSKRRVMPPDYRDRLEAERRQFVKTIGQEGALAGITAFLERMNRRY